MKRWTPGARAFTHTSVCGSEQRKLKQQQGKPCGAQGIVAMDHSLLAGLPPFPGYSFTFPINVNPFWLLTRPASHLLQLLLLCKQPHEKGIHSKGLLQVWLLCSVYGSEGAARSVQVSGSVRRKIISIVGRKGNLMGEFIGLFSLFWIASKGFAFQ